jgi:ketosteroid isomerase-like protein
MMLYRSVVLFILLVSTATLQGQNDELRIRNLREASNQAIKSYDHEKVLSFLTEDVLTTTGAGTLLAGKEALRSYIAEAPNSQMYWVRTPSEIRINEVTGLAWETGTWQAYDPSKSSDPLPGGNYSAMWTRASGQWKIKSQLFVTLH